ncbi:MAG: hypothetical protein EBT30_09355, partial [Verrucomicrobia bacterium]|nr:hypothetical protein [Verrucomicrobiota bacterium]
TASTLDPTSGSYGWTDQGLVLESFVDDPGGYNAIDPKMHVEVAGENGAGGNSVGKNWLMWGSYWSGIFVTSLNRSTGKSPGASRYQLAARPMTNGTMPGIEGSTVVWRNGYYYLFVSYDVYESYNVRVGRSASLTGPYVDRQGRSMTNGFATPVLAPYAKWRNTGHNDVQRFYPRPAGAAAFLGERRLALGRGTDHPVPVRRGHRPAWLLGPPDRLEQHSLDHVRQ